LFLILLSVAVLIVDIAKNRFVKCVPQTGIGCMISGSHTGGYEEFCLLGYNAM
jgi:hypothetical protein